MKKIIKTILFSMVAVIFSVPALIAAPENHEEFARQYMPEAQAIFERFRKECSELESLSVELLNDLKSMNRKFYDDASYCALMAKIKVLKNQEAEWVKLVKDCYFKHKGNLLTIDQLSGINSRTAKEKIEWEKEILKPFLRNFVELKNICAPVMVKIPGENYSIGMFEVTQREYLSVMGENPSRFKGGNLPVEKVSWNDAMKFCEKLTMRERAAGRLPEGYKYTLPTSKQWESACNAGKTKEENSNSSWKDLKEYAWYYENSNKKTHPVGTKVANEWGIYDMHGNVRELCLEQRSSGFIQTHPIDRLSHIQCGGSWACGDGFYDSKYIMVLRSKDCYDDLGFRVALVPVDDEKFQKFSYQQLNDCDYE